MSSELASITTGCEQGSISLLTSADVTQSSAGASESCSYTAMTHSSERSLDTFHTEQGETCALDLQLLKLVTGGARSKEVAAREELRGGEVLGPPVEKL